MSEYGKHTEELQRHLPRLLKKCKPCPFCGEMPDVFPKNPDEEGNAWGEVACVSDKCAVNPQVSDGSDIADERGTPKYIECAIRRWNKRKP